MNLGRRSKPRTLADRAGAVGRATGDVAKAAGNLARAAGEGAAEVTRTVRDRSLDVSRSGRSRALAVAGAATGAAAGFAFWRSQHDSRPSVHSDPAAKPAPWKTPPAAKRPVTDTGAAADEAAGSRSK